MTFWLDKITHCSACGIRSSRLWDGIWSARTCPRPPVGRTRPAASFESGDRSPHCKTRWTLAESTVQFRIMWRLFPAFLLLITPALAQENATAYVALRVVGAQFGSDALNH